MVNVATSSIENWDKHTIERRGCTHHDRLMLGSLRHCGHGIRGIQVAQVDHRRITTGGTGAISDIYCNSWKSGSIL